MKEKRVLAGGLIAISLAIAGPALAEQIPFNQTVPVPAQQVTNGDSQNVPQNFVGTCVGSNCTGVGFVASANEGNAGTSAGSANVSGLICIADATPPCNTFGSGTGVRPNNPVIVLPWLSAGFTYPSAHGQLCVWANSVNPVQCQSF